MKQFVQQLTEYAVLYRDTKTGIAWVEDGASGNWHSAHPNIDVSGSVAGMKNLGYWTKDARCVKSHGFIYNIDLCVVTTAFDEVARTHCQCGGNHG